MSNIKILLSEKKREQENILTMWTNDVKAASKKPGFDETSKKGEKILNKIAVKYAAMLVEIEDEVKELEKKLEEDK